MKSTMMKMMDSMVLAKEDTVDVFNRATLSHSLCGPVLRLGSTHCIMNACTMSTWMVAGQRFMHWRI